MGTVILRRTSLLLLALVFTAGLTFATVELPYRVDELLQNTVQTPGGDSHADALARFKTELFMAHYHVRAIGYAAFFLQLGLGDRRSRRRPPMAPGTGGRDRPREGRLWRGRWPTPTMR